MSSDKYGPITYQEFQKILKKQQRKEKRALEKRWRQHLDEHPLGLMKPIREGAGANDALHDKFAQIVEYIDPEMSTEVRARLWKVLRICPGMQIHAKQGPKDQAQKQGDARKEHMLKLAQVAKYMHEDGIETESIACEEMGIDRGQFGREKKPLKSLWIALRNDHQFCLDFLKRVEQPTAALSEEQLERWCEEHPAKKRVEPKME